MVAEKRLVLADESELLIELRDSQNSEGYFENFQIQARRSAALSR